MALDNLPEWAMQKASESVKVATTVVVDSAAAYKEWLSLLGVVEVDQYWLEVAYQCAKLDVHNGLAGSDCDPRTCGKPSEIKFSNAPEFALAKHPEGRGVAAATQGREARGHYVKIRGRMPF